MTYIKIFLSPLLTIVVHVPSQIDENTHSVEGSQLKLTYPSVKTCTNLLHRWQNSPYC